MSRILVAVFGVVTALAVAGYAVGAASHEPAARVAVCIKPNGQLRAVTATSPCVTPEEQEEWTVHGVEEIQAGAGLVGRNVGGFVTLNVDPGLIEQANAGRIIAGFDDGPNQVDMLTKHLALPEGAYAITAKLTVANSEPPFAPSGSGPQHAVCKLSAGSDFDESRAIVGGPAANATLNDRTRALGLTLAVVHRFASDGVATLSCETAPAYLCFIDCPEDQPLVFEDLKIVAIRATSLSNQFLG